MLADRLAEGPRIRYASCADTPLEGEANAFYAFFVLGENLASVHRRFNLDLPGLAHRPDRYSSQIILTTYSASAERVLAETERVLCTGEDPRVVSDSHRAFILCRVFDSQGTSRAPYKLFVLPDEAELDIVPPPMLEAGKNWQPFLRDGRLFAVHSFAPLRVVEIAEDGQVRLIHSKATEFWLPAPHDRYTMVRGGSNAMASGNEVIGFGHLTRCRDDHRPFVWALGPSMQMALWFPSSFLGLRTKGFGIIDPTSLFLFEGRLHLGLCCSEREWFYGQRFLNLLVELPCSDVQSLCGGVHTGLFGALEDSALTGLPASRTYIATDMPHQVPVREADGGVETLGHAGCLLHGPYEPIDEEGSYKATLTYMASPAQPGQPAGRFEVSCYRHGQVDTLGAVPLSGTEGRAVTVPLVFSTASRTGWLLETRVFAEEGARLNALSVRVIREEDHDGLQHDAPRPAAHRSVCGGWHDTG
jgi:hypothetical protein